MTLNNNTEFEIFEDTPDHHFRTEIPNIVFEMGLSPEAFCVYAHLKRIAGDRGACFKSNKKLAECCGMGETKLRECLKELCDISILIGDDENSTHTEISLIKITHRKKDNGSWDTSLITITPIWRLNGDVMRSRSKKKIGTSPREGGVPRHAREGTSPREDKEEPLKREPLKESASEAPPPSLDDKNANSEKAKALVNEIKEFNLPIPENEIIRWIKYYGIKYTHRTIASCAMERNLLKKQNPVRFLQSALAADYFDYKNEKDNV